MKKSYGLFVGLDYAGSGNDLQGGVTDALSYMDAIGPHCTEPKQLLEKEATSTAILKTLLAIISKLKYGDVLFFTFSGHGSWLPDESGDEPDGRDEVLVSYDMDRCIPDDYLRNAFAKRARGSKIVFVSDCCYSGTVFRMFIPTNGAAHVERRVRFVPPTAILSGKPARRAAAITQRMAEAPARPPVKSNAPQSGVIHLAACRETELANEDQFGNRFNGVFTHYFLNQYRLLPAKGTYEQVMVNLRTTNPADRLPQSPYWQSPMLNATAADRRRVMVGK